MRALGLTCTYRIIIDVLPTPGRRGFEGDGGRKGDGGRFRVEDFTCIQLAAHEAVVVVVRVVV